MTWQQGIQIASERYDILQIIHNKKHIYAKVKCKICGKDREATVSQLALEKECKNCKKNRELKEKQLKFIADMEIINPDIELLGLYFSRDKRVRCRCKIDKHEWEPFAGNLLSGHGCPECQKRLSRQIQLKDHDVFLKQLHVINPNLELLGHYSGSSVNTLTRCKVCGHIWSPRPDNLLSGFGCPECASKNKFYTNEQFMTKLKDKWPNIELTSTYKDSYTHISVKCMTCGHEWTGDPSQILFHCGCPKCAEKIKHAASMPNRVLYAVLDFLKVKYIPEFKYSGTSSRFDVYIPSVDIIIEMHGMQHYKDVSYWNSYVKDVQINDTYKKSLAESYNILHYIVVDARFSRFNWILKNIANSELPGLLNTSSEKILEKRDEIADIFKTIK